MSAIGNHHTIILDTCPDCDGDGGFESTPYSYNPVTGEPTTYWQECLTCGGGGDVETEYQCRTLDDLEAEEDEMLAAGTHYLDEAGLCQPKLLRFRPA